MLVVHGHINSGERSGDVGALSGPEGSILGCVGFCECVSIGSQAFGIVSTQ